MKLVHLHPENVLLNKLQWCLIDLKNLNVFGRTPQVLLEECDLAIETRALTSKKYIAEQGKVMAN